MTSATQQRIYDCTPSAKRFHEAPQRVKVLWGPVGSGKSSSGFWEFVFQASESPVPLRGVVIRSSYRELRDTSLRTFMEWFGHISDYKERDDTAVVTLPHPTTGEPQQHELMFRSLQRPEDTKKLQSLEVGFVFMEEVVPTFSTSGVLGQGLPEEIFGIANTRLRQQGCHRYTLVLVANPPTPDHWFYKRFVSGTEEALVAMDAVVVFQPPGENAKNLSPGYYETLRRSLPGDLVRRLIDGEVVVAFDGERVFPECRDNFHVVDRTLVPVEGVELVLGFDFGITPSTLITQITPSGQWLWLGELQSWSIGIDQHCEYLSAMMQERWPGFEFRCWGDPAGSHRSQNDAVRAFDVARSKGFRIRPSENSLTARLEAIKQRLERNVLGEPALLISRPHCSTAVQAMLGGYRRHKNADGRIHWKPMKNHFSHIMDAAQYVAVREFKISGIRPVTHHLPQGGSILIPPPDPFRPMGQPGAPYGDHSWMGKL